MQVRLSDDPGIVTVIVNESLGAVSPGSEALLSLGPKLRLGPHFPEALLRVGVIMRSAQRTRSGASRRCVTKQSLVTREGRGQMEGNRLRCGAPHQRSQL